MSAEHTELMIMFEKAKRISTDVHMNQKDKAGEPYLGHIQRVMFKCDTIKERIVACLHDVVEDSDGKWTIQKLREAGFTEEICAAIDCITRRPGEAYDAYLIRVESNELATRDKIKDLEDNMDIRRLKEIDDEAVKRLRKYLAAWHRLKAHAEAKGWID